MQIRQARQSQHRKRTGFHFFSYFCGEISKAESLNLELFIARKLLKGDPSGNVSVPIVKIALIGIALGVCVMLLSIFIITGFKQEITAKLSGFSAHLNVSAYENDDSYNGSNIVLNDTLAEEIGSLTGVKQVYPYITKPAIIESGNEIHGVILRGINAAYDAAFYEKHLKNGEVPDFATPTVTNEILISSSVADLLGVVVGDKVTAHFVQEPPRARAFRIKGIYDTGFKEYDDMLVLCDIRHLQRLNGWEAGEVTGLAIELTDIEKTQQVGEAVDLILPLDENNNFYKLTTLHQLAPQVFDWLNLLNMNVWIILTLIVVVAGFNMVSGLLILILDKTSLIGVLKALGYRNIALRRLFLYIAVGLIGRGMLAGNVLAFLLGGIQYFFHIIRLDPNTYYMDTVPVNFNPGYILLLNIGVLVVSVGVLIVPTMLISRIKPIRAIRFE